MVTQPAANRILILTTSLRHRLGLEFLKLRTRRRRRRQLFHMEQSPEGHRRQRSRCQGFHQSPCCRIQMHHRLPGTWYYFYAVWTCPPPPPVYGDTFQAGAVLEPPEGLQDGTLAAWAAGAWARFSQFVVENALVVTQARIEIVYLGDEIGEGATRRWFADPLFQTQTFIGSFGLGWTLEISYIST